MANSKLRDIADALVAAIQNISGIGSTGKRPVHWDEEENFPACYVAFAGESKSHPATKTKEGFADFNLICYVQSENPQDDFYALYKDIETQIEADVTLGGKAIDAVVIGSNVLVTAESIAGNLYLADVFVRVQYRHTTGTP